jgi:ElaB/YqjD/DUF883 family membrane-anchored ribosome-binding protein
MTFPAGAATAVETLKERLTPALETLDDTIRQGKRAIVRGQHVAADAADAAALQIRKHPMSAVMTASIAGALAGCLIGFGLGWITGSRNA